MGCRLPLVVLMLMAVTLAGCSGYSDKSNFSLPTITPFGLWSATPPAEGKGTVLLSAAIEGISCAEKRFVLATADGDGFKTARVERIESTFDGGDGAAVIELAPGTYHVVQVTCRNGAYVVHAGTNPKQDAVPWLSERWTRSLASFSVNSSDVLDAGELALIPGKVAGFTAGISGRKAEVSMRPSPERALAEIVRSRPELAPRLHTTWMQIDDTNAFTIAKCRLDSPQKPLPRDGSSKLPEVLAEHPEAVPVVKSIGTATTDADSCVPSAEGAVAKTLGSLQ